MLVGITQAAWVRSATHVWVSCAPARLPGPGLVWRSSQACMDPTPAFLYLAKGAKVHA